MKNYLKVALIGLALLSTNANGSDEVQRPPCKDVCAYDVVNPHFRFVQIKNSMVEPVVCRIIASNGAKYEFYVTPKTLSRYYRINDVAAQWRWDCKIVPTT